MRVEIGKFFHLTVSRLQEGIGGEKRAWSLRALTLLSRLFASLIRCPWICRSRRPEGKGRGRHPQKLLHKQRGPWVAHPKVDHIRRRNLVSFEYRPTTPSSSFLLISSHITRTSSYSQAVISCLSFMSPARLDGSFIRSKNIISASRGRREREAHPFYVCRVKNSMFP